MGLIAEKPPPKGAGLNIVVRGTMLQPSYIQLALGYCLYHVSNYLTDIILCGLQVIGIRRYVIHGNNDKYPDLVKRLETDTYNSSFIYRKSKIIKTGYFVGNMCAGYYSNDPNFIDDEKITIITTPKYFEQLTADTDRSKVIHTFKVTHASIPTEQKSLIKVFLRNGPYRSFWYTPLTMDMTGMVPMGEQAPVVTQTVDIYNAKGRAVIFIHGVTGAGKSSVGYMVAKEIGANYTNTFRPTDPGDSFGNLLSELRSRDEMDTPLVIVLEEANLMIHAIHEGTIERHREIPVPISDKTNWVNFFDNLIFYRNIVVILTSNESKDALDALDPAYLRKGRIDATFSMMTALDI